MFELFQILKDYPNTLVNVTYYYNFCTDQTCENVERFRFSFSIDQEGVVHAYLDSSGYVKSFSFPDEVVNKEDEEGLS